MTDDEATQLADYECALETIGNVIALKARDIADEQRKATPDKTRIDALRREQAELASERGKLRIGDREGIARDRAVRQACASKRSTRSPFSSLVASRAASA